MNYLGSSIISHLKSATFYKGIFSIKSLFKEFVNIMLHASSFPLTVNLLITGQCNFSCKMCPGKNPGTMQNYDQTACLNITDLRNFISRIKIHHPLIHIGGGEPFMRSDLLEAVAAIKNNKLKCLISTNGFLMNEDDIDKLVKLKVDVLIFSLYGLEGTHDIITQVKGSFNKAIVNLESILRKRTKHTKIFVSTLALPENINEIKQLTKKLYDLGIDGVKIEQLNFLTQKEYERVISDGKSPDFNPSIFIRNSHFDHKFVIDLISVYKDIQKTFKNFVYVKPYLSEAQVMNWYGAVPCRASRCFFIAHSVFINYNGDVIPCQFFKESVLGNIKKDTLESIWNSQEYRALRKNINSKKSIVCLRCCKN